MSLLSVAPRQIQIGVFAVILFVIPHSAVGGLIVSVDLDPSTPAIETTHSFAVGVPFPVDLVLTDDGVSPLTPSILITGAELSFNDSGAVLSSSGIITTTTPISALPAFESLMPVGITIVDAYGGGSLPPPISSTPLTVAAGTPSAGYSSTTGSSGITAASPGKTLPPGTSVVLYSTTFTPTAPGTSTIIAGSGAGIGGGVIALDASYDPIPNTFVASTVTVIPEPSTLALTALGLLGLLTFAWRRRGR